MMSSSIKSSNRGAARGIRKLFLLLLITISVTNIVTNMAPNMAPNTANNILLVYGMPSLPAHSSRTTSKDYPYSFSLSTFNPEGRLIQVELADKAADKGTPVVAFRNNNNDNNDNDNNNNNTITLMTPVELPSNLTIAPLYNKIFTLTPTVSMTYAGIPGDYRLLTRSVVLTLEGFRKR